MFQPIQIETQSEQQGLTHLRTQGAARGPCRELSFHRREQAFDQGAAAVKPLRESASHLGADPAYAPGFLSTFGGNHALRRGRCRVGNYRLQWYLKSHHKVGVGLILLV